MYHVLKIIFILIILFLFIKSYFYLKMIKRSKYSIMQKIDIDYWYELFAEGQDLFIKTKGIKCFSGHFIKKKNIKY